MFRKISENEGSSFARGPQTWDSVGVFLGAP